MKTLLKSTGQEILPIYSMVDKGGREPCKRGYMRFLVPNKFGKAGIQIIHKSKVRTEAA